MLAAPQPIVNYKALSWTVGAHVLILLLLGWWTIMTPVSFVPVQELGMEVNLGTSADGSGADQPMEMDDPAEAVAVHSRPSAAREDEALRDMERTEENDAPEVPPTRATHVAGNTPRESTPIPNHATRPEVTPSPAPAARPVPQRPKYVMPGGTGRGGNGAMSNAPGTSEGNTFGNGDRGVPHGTPGAANYTGSHGTGTGGISYNLAGRNLVAVPSLEAEFREGGRVVFRITVNREGAIINPQVISSSNPELRSIAVEKLRRVKFNRSESSPVEQFGTFTIKFKPRS